MGDPSSMYAAMMAKTRSYKELELDAQKAELSRLLAAQDKAFAQQSLPPLPTEPCFGQKVNAVYGSRTQKQIEDFQRDYNAQTKRIAENQKAFIEDKILYNTPPPPNYIARDAEIEKLRDCLVQETQQHRKTLDHLGERDRQIMEMIRERELSNATLTHYTQASEHAMKRTDLMGADLNKLRRAIGKIQYDKILAEKDDV